MRTFAAAATLGLWRAAHSSRPRPLSITRHGGIGVPSGSRNLKSALATVAATRGTTCTIAWSLYTSDSAWNASGVTQNLAAYGVPLRVPLANWISPCPAHTRMPHDARTAHAARGALRHALSECITWFVQLRLPWTRQVKGCGLPMQQCVVVALSGAGNRLEGDDSSTGWARIGQEIWGGEGLGMAI